MSTKTFSLLFGTVMLVCVVTVGAVQHHRATAREEMSQKFSAVIGDKNCAIKGYVGGVPTPYYQCVDGWRVRGQIEPDN